MSTESELLAEVEALKAKFSDTRALYREVCALLFFRYGVTPTANKLYQYVRRGSMNVPTEEVGKFWDELRHNARVDIQHPDLPEEIKTLAAEAVAGLWRQASDAARGELASVRLELQADTERARRGQEAAEQAVTEVRHAMEQLRLELEQKHEALVAVQDALEAERRSQAATHARAQELKAQLEQARIQQQKQQDGFSADLAKAREAADIAQERAAAAERRSLTEIDQERQARAKADRTTETLRGKLADAEMRERQSSLEHTQAATRMQFEANSSKAALERALEAQGDLQHEVEALKRQLGESMQTSTRAQAEAQTLQAMVERLAAMVNTPGRPVRKKNSKTVP